MDPDTSKSSSTKSNMQSVSLTTLDPLKPVHHEIFEILKKQIPLTMMQVSDEFYQHLIPLVYEKVYLNSWNCRSFTLAIAGVVCPQARSVKYLSVPDEEVLLQLVRTAFKLVNKFNEESTLYNPQAEPIKLFPNLTHINFGQGIVAYWGSILDEDELRYPQQRAILKTGNTIVKYCNLTRICFDFPEDTEIYYEISEDSGEPMWDSVMEGIYHFTRIDAIQECTYHLHRTDFIDRWIHFPLFHNLNVDVRMEFIDNNEIQNVTRASESLGKLCFSFGDMVERMKDPKKHTINFIIPDHIIWHRALEALDENLEGKFGQSTIDGFKERITFRDQGTEYAECGCTKAQA